MRKRYEETEYSYFLKYIYFFRMSTHPKEVIDIQSEKFVVVILKL